MGPQPFNRPASVTLNGAGYGYCTVTVPNGVSWEVDLLSVSTTAGFNATTNPPVCNLYRDSAPNQSHFVEGTNSGNGDTSNTVHRLSGGDSLTAEWVGGTAATIATLRVQGMQREVWS